MRPPPADPVEGKVSPSGGTSSPIGRDRILFVITNLERGGAEQLLLDTVRHLDQVRFEPEVAYLDESRKASESLVQEFRDLGCPIHCLEGRGIRSARRLRRLVRDRAPTILHVHLPYAGIVARVAIPRGGPPIVYTEHGVWEFYKAHRRMTYWGTVLTHGRNQSVLAVSDAVLHSLRYPRAVGFLRVPPARTLYHGVDHGAVKGWLSCATEVRRDLGIPENAPVVGCVANFRAVKGHRYLLEAVERARRVFPDLRLVLVGRGDAEQDIRRRARELGLGDAVIFPGYQAHAPRVASAFDIFALPSLHEALPISVIEAMALRKPLVVTNVGGIPEIVENGEQGFIVPPADVEALTDGITRLVADPGLRERFGDAAGRRARELDIRRTVRELERIYAELLGVESAPCADAVLMGARA